MMMKIRTTYICYILLGMMIYFCSCQKDSGGDPGNNPKSPKLGTVWTCRYYIYHQDGSLSSSTPLTLKAKTEESFGGEKWLRIVNMANDTTIYLLRVKSDGLYQYTNNNSYLLCKYPATVNENYTTYNEGGAENFIVKDINILLPTGLGDIRVNYYEGFKGPDLIDMLWYNPETWIVRKTQYRNRSLVTPSFYKYSTLFIDQITY